MEQAQYHLYVIRPDDIDSEKERHYLITPDYCLLYTQNVPTAIHEEIIRLDNLPAPVWEWLKERIDIIRAEYLKEHQKELLDKAVDFTEKFKQALEEEKKKLDEAEKSN